jgi:hypothetical protein
MVKIKGNASGIAPTDKAKVVIKTAYNEEPESNPNMKMKVVMIIAKIDSRFTKLFIFCCSGVFSLILSIALDICPIFVFIPVFVTIALHFPLTTNVPAKISSPTFLFTGTLSPVKIDSSTFKLIVSITLASAGILSPASNIITSPGTSSLASIT